MPGHSGEYLSVRETARLVRVNEKTVRAAIADGSLPAARFGRVFRVRRADVDALFRRRL